MHINTQHHFDASPAAVRAMLMDPKFWQSLAVGHVNHCDAAQTADGVQVDLGVQAPAEAKRLTGETLNATLEAAWKPTGDNAWSGPVAIAVKGLPASFSGTSTITPDGEGTSVAYEGDLTIRLPLIGPSLEAKAAPYLLGVLDAQQAAGTLWLARA